MRRNNRALVERWFVGIGAAAMLVIYGVYCLIVQRACFFVSRTLLHNVVIVTGWAAIVLAAGYIAFGVAVHLLFFWSEHPRFGKVQYSLTAIFIFLLCYGIAAFGS